jgi:hypothetical protein
MEKSARELDLLMYSTGVDLDDIKTLTHSRILYISFKIGCYLMVFNVKDLIF